MFLFAYMYINNFNPDFQNFDFCLPSYNPFKSKTSNSISYEQKIYFLQSTSCDQKSNDKISFSA